MHDDPTDPGPDVVARRVVIQRSDWDRCVKLADRMRGLRGTEPSPAEIAAMALGRGLELVEIYVRKTESTKRAMRSRGPRRPPS